MKVAPKRMAQSMVIGYACEKLSETALVSFLHKGEHIVLIVEVFTCDNVQRKIPTGVAPYDCYLCIS